MNLKIKPKEQCRWDIVSLGEIMIRFDPGPRRIWTTRSFDVCEGGGEYDVSRGLKRCFGLDPWSSRTFWIELALVAAKAALLLCGFAAAPMQRFQRLGQRCGLDDLQPEHMDGFTIRMYT